MKLKWNYLTVKNETFLKNIIRLYNFQNYNLIIVIDLRRIFFGLKIFWYHKDHRRVDARVVNGDGL